MSLAFYQAQLTNVECGGQLGEGRTVLLESYRECSLITQGKDDV